MADQHNNRKDTIGNDRTQRPDELAILADRYRIIRRIGEGGMGSVSLAEDIKLDGLQVAIKMLPPELSANKRAMQQLKAEARTGLQLAHPNIATLRAFEESKEGAFLVMDYIPGQNLDDLLAERGTLSEEETMRLFKPIAKALDYAHSYNVIHRDIKPSNILIGEDGTPYITDFGIAREAKETMTRVTGRSTSGTLPYMSPEQLRGAAPSAPQDVYGLAATMYECLSGNPPFHRGEIRHQIENVSPPSLASDSFFTKSILAGLSKSPEDRPDKPSELFAPSTQRSKTVVEDQGEETADYNHESPSNGPSESASSGSWQQREDNLLAFFYGPVFVAIGAVVTMFIGAALGTVFLDINSSDESEEFVQFLAGIGAIIGGAIGGGIWGWHVENVCIGLGVGTGFAIGILLGSVAAGIICMALFAAIGWVIGRAIRSWV